MAIRPMGSPTPAAPEPTNIITAREAVATGEMETQTRPPLLPPLRIIAVIPVAIPQRRRRPW